MLEVAGYLDGLRAGLSSLGHDARVHTLEDHPFGYGTDDRSLPQRVVRWTARRRATGGGATRPLWLVADAVAKLAFLVWAAARYDVFVISAGRSLFELRELWLLRVMRKTTVCMFFGSDERPPYCNGAYLSRTDPPTATEHAQLARRLRHRVRRADRWSTWVVSHPPSSHFHTRPVVQLLALGIPVAQPSGDRPRSSRPVVAHAPSNAAAKGSTLIRTAVAEARRAGIDFDYEEIVDRPHAEVLQLYARTDIVLDEVWSDSPLSVTAAEASAAGTVTIVGGVDWPFVETSMARLPAIPTVRVGPDDIGSTLIDLLRDGGRRRELGAAAQRYASAWLTPTSVARRVVRLVEEGPEEAWLHDPRATIYTAGVSAPTPAVRSAVADVIATVGVHALGLEDKPQVERAFVELVRDDDRAE